MFVMATDITPTTSISFDPALVPSGVPELENGDRLTRAEFERRYAAMPNVKKAELIEGVVYMPSPVRLIRHGVPHGQFIVWIGNYSAATEGVLFADNASDRLDLDNEYQPDGMLYIKPECGGRITISQDDYVEGGPELVGEISSSSASYDLGPKMTVYRRSGVSEYIVWRVLERAIDWFALREGKYEKLPAGPDGVFRSEVFPGLWLDAAAMTRGHMARVMQVLSDGLASDAHRQFAAKLREAKQNAHQ
jgi:Uma2 family endonuclease